MPPASEAVLHDAKQRDQTLPDPSRPRFGETAKFLPVSFVFFIICCLYSTYVFRHCVPLMRTPDTHVYGMACLVVFNLLFAMIITCYFRSMLQHPGTIPENASVEEGKNAWEYPSQPSTAAASLSDADVVEQRERKKLGERRHCKWCNKYKPDRCHHCRVCRMCILKMDHHCPWIYNCVGFKNFKYFFLLVTYASAASLQIVITMLRTTRDVSTDPRSTFLEIFWILFGETLSGVIAFLLVSFLMFHIHLMLKGMTTIEFCEKSRRPNFDTDIYSVGLLGNIQAVLGENPLLWLLPISPPSGDGMSFPSSEALVLRTPRRASDNKYWFRNYGSMPASQSNQNSSAGTGEQPDYSDAGPVRDNRSYGAS